MKKIIYQLVMSSLFLASSSSALADISGIQYQSSQSSNTQNIAKYLSVLGMYLGYDLSNYCPGTGGTCPSQTPGSSGTGQQSFSNLLLNSTLAYTNQINLMTTFIGALLPTLPKNSGSTQQSTFQVIPTSESGLNGYANLFTQYGNMSFAQQSTSFSTPSENSFSVSALIDQQPYQNDPVSQAVLNILSTPDASFCINNQNGGYNNPCYTGNNNGNQFGGGPVLSQNQITINTIGSPFPQPPNYPGTGYFALGSKNTQIVPQLSSDSLLGPLMFDNSGQSQNNNTSSSQNNGAAQGLTAQTQVQQAANFIRYATGAVVPLTLANRTSYDNLYATATNQAGNISAADQVKAQSTLSTYLNNLRVYAAQISVGISNLYSLLSRRMPQKTATNTNNTSSQSSQALSEYMMATWRLYSPQTTGGNSQNQQWVAQINQASSATVQKEIAILLAEINYQLYLSRQQQERLLLTNSMLLIQNARQPQSLPKLGANGSDDNDSNQNYQ